jgi:dolichol-phosphate mannosyltransferase
LTVQDAGASPKFTSAGNIALSVVIPCYNESDALPLLRKRLLQALPEIVPNWEVILVDDGSSDDTAAQLAAMHEADSRFKVIRLSRNFGHQAAICAGLAFTSGQAVGIMDADLQDPPEVLAGCLQKLREGYDVVYAVRRKRKEGVFKRAAYALFYRILTLIAEVNIPLDSGDFCLMSERVATLLSRMPERNYFLRGLRAWTGFRQFGFEYEREARAAGTTKYSFKRLVRLAMAGVFSFSTMPLRLATYLGLFGVGISVLGGLFVLIWRLFGFEFMGRTAQDLPGWAGIAGGMFFLGGLQFLILGCMGEYIGRIYTEVKQRPRWIVRETLGIPDELGQRPDSRS